MNIQIPKSRWYHKLLQSVAATSWGARIAVPTFHHLDRFVFKLTVGHATLSSFVAGLPIVMVTSTGAKSGLPRRLPLIGIPHPQRENALAIIASNYGQKHYPSWYYNLKANPQASVEYHGAMYTCNVYEAEGDEYQQLWNEADTCYVGYAAYRNRVGERHIPIMVLTTNF